MAKKSGMKFDAKKVLARQKKVTAQFMKMYGQDVQRAAKALLGRKPKKPKPGELVERSKPGQPPKNQTGTIKRLVRFGLSDTKQSVAIGPIQFEGESQGAYALEYGGKTKLKIRPISPGKPVKRRVKAAKRRAKKR